MYKILSAAQMRKCDEYTYAKEKDSLGFCGLMERAADAAGRVLSQSFDISDVLIVCGSGNNGGDGFALARILLEERFRAVVLYCGARDHDGNIDKSRMSAECAYMLEKYLGMGGKLFSLPECDMKSYSVIVDAIFGIGLSRDIEGEYAETVEKINSSGTAIFSLDIPSGVCADNGKILGCAVKADMTVSFGQYKIGQLCGEGIEHCGKLVLENIGIGTEAAEKAGEKLFTALGKDDLFTLLPKRQIRSNKGTYGRVLVIGGDSGMCGAVYFVAKAAYRCGAGLVEILTSGDNRIPLQTLIPEAIVNINADDDPLISAIRRADAISIGCGMNVSKENRRMLEITLENAVCPVVIDAGALNILAAYPELWKLVKENTIITPHPGEMSRLCGKTIEDILASVPETAKAFASKHDIVCVLKDARTAICSDAGTSINIYGNSGMATGGSGDALTGIIASLLAQSAKNKDTLGCFNAARLGVLIHSLAGDIAASEFGEYGMTVTELIESIVEVTKSAQKEKQRKYRQ